MASQDDWLTPLTEQAAAVLGPIASVLAEQAAADGASVQEVRQQLAAQMDEGARKQFLRATEPLAAKARSSAPVSKPPAPEAARGAAAPVPAATTADTLDRSDPAFVQGLARYLASNIGPDGESMVMEAARRCRTKMQLCMRVANGISDPSLKDMLLRRALDESKAAAPRKA